MNYNRSQVYLGNNLKEINEKNSYSDIQFPNQIILVILANSNINECISILKKGDDRAIEIYTNKGLMSRPR